MKAKLRLVFAFPFIFIGFYAQAQDAPGIWRADAYSGNRVTASRQALLPQRGAVFAMDEGALRSALEPLNDSGNRSAVVRFPDGSGHTRAYRVEERSVLSPALQARYPQIRTYLGISTDGDGSRIRFSMTPKGFQGMLSEAGSQQARFIERMPDNPSRYLIFSRDMKAALPASWSCKTEAVVTQQAAPATLGMLLNDDQTLRRYRLAVSATGEYTEYHGGTVAGALAAIAATLARINEVFERDLAISLELIANTDQVIYPDPLTDPYGGNFSSEVQNTLDTQIGDAAYDIGHLFHSGNESGNAGFIGAVCRSGQKGSAFASTPTPEGDRFDLDFVAHEMGHQFGANHTWSFESEGTGVQAEPASGTTIMGYAGIAQGNNVAVTGDDYFHYFSIVQISQYVAGTSCAAEVALSNNPPLVAPLPDYIIPQGTPFVLEAVATDADATDVLTYAWEQVDDGVVTTATFGPTSPGGANFRSLMPDTVPRRYFPRLDRVASGDLTQVNPATGSAWETVSTIERDLNFAVTVRDNAPGGGQSASDLVRVRVLAGPKPFELLSQQGPQTYNAGSIQSVNWEVAGTDQGPINCQQVDIFLSLDGGQTFPVQLGAGLPNTGSAQVQLPGLATTTGRIMVKASNNIFFAVNRADITIAEQPFILAADALAAEACQPGDAVFGFTYFRFGGFTETVTLDVSGLPAGLSAGFSVASVQADATAVLLTLSGTGSVLPGTYPLVLSGTGTTATFSLPFELQLADGSFSAPVLLQPADAEVDVSLEPELQWQDNPAYTSYKLELATDAAFTAIVEQQMLYNTRYRPTALQAGTQYFWRIKPANSCGEGAYTAPFSFTTITSDCKTLSAKGLPLAISATGTPTITSDIVFADDRPVIGARVTLDIDHSYLSDLVITLRSPAGTEVTLVANSCADADGLAATFDAAAPPFVCGNDPAISGTVRPVGSLNAFAGESSLGQWTLTIQDTAPADGGQLNAFGLELCVEGLFRPDADGDGVFDDGDDLCPGTPAGTEVDATGCPVYRFDPEQFEIALSGENCIGGGDGSIRITASEALDYTVTIQGNGLDETADFNSSFEQRNLSTGSYQLCITGTDGTITYEPQCFDLNIPSPDPLSVLVGQSSDGALLDVSLGGSEFYQVSLNGVTQTVSGDRITLALAKGENQLEVLGIPACKGSYQATYFYAESFRVSPNPFTEYLDLYTPLIGSELRLRLFSLGGKQVFATRLQPVANSVRVPMPSLPTGLYLLELRSGTQFSQFKIFRR